ncbi:MAG: glycosyltransferase, partial [Nitrososphaerales archaeon]
PSVMFRSQLVQDIGLYPLDTPAAEDYAFFFKIIKKYKAQNIPESLVDCIMDPDGISTKKRKIQIKSRISIILKNFEFNPYAIYGLLRSCALLYTPRGLTVFLNKAKNTLFNY